MLEMRDLSAPREREGKVIRRYVVSAPRSGLNWLRFCAEYFYGVPTPGRQLLIPKDETTAVAFIRSHNPIGHKRPEKRISLSNTVDGRLVLILRHPLETFVRSADKKLKRFECYPSNIKFYSESGGSKAVYYYEDLVKSPLAMASALDFLQIEPAAGRSKPSCEDLERDWDTASWQSRAAYDVNQVRGGGAKTKANPFDFGFHQKSLWPWQRAKVWRYLHGRLSPEQMNLLDRYRGG